MPRPPAPLLRAYGYVGANAIYGALRLLSRTCDVVIDNGEALSAHASYVLCYWHADAVSGFVFIFTRREPFAALCHPAWQLEPWKVLGEMLRWRVALGSSGHGGKDAAQKVIDWLREGHSTFVCPDGPAGPPRALKRGVLHMAAAARAPIIPLVFEPRAALTLPRWDRMRVPLPFSTLRVRCGEPIWVEEDTLEEAARRLAAALGGEIA